MMRTSINLALRRLGHEDHESEASLDYTVRPSGKTWGEVGGSWG